MIAVGRGLIFASSDGPNAVITHQPAYTAMSGLKAHIAKFFYQTGTPISVQVQPMSFPNMSQQAHIDSLPLAHRTASPGPKASGCYTEHSAKPFDRIGLLPRVYKGKALHF